MEGAFPAGPRRAQRFALGLGGSALAAAGVGLRLCQLHWNDRGELPSAGSRRSRP